MQMMMRRPGNKQYGVIIIVSRLGYRQERA